MHQKSVDKPVDKTALPPMSRISVAPMMDWTDRHCRYFHRLISPHAPLYTEMVHAQAVIHNAARLLPFDESEHPVVLQLGGSDPDSLAQAAKIGESFGYDAINLNCGCPSERVQNGKFGACLMAEPDLVAACIAAMRATVKIPVTVKCRIGLNDSYDPVFLENFIRTVKNAGCKTFIIHARTAILKGLSPKENRDIPPLRPDMAADIKTAHPDLSIILNGGIRSVDQVLEGLKLFDGVMIGREAYHNPMILAQIGSALTGAPLPDRATIARAMSPYIEHRIREEQTPPHAIFRHMLGLYAARPGAVRWRRILGDAPKTAARPPSETIEDALPKLSTHSQTNLF